MGSVDDSEPDDGQLAIGGERMDAIIHAVGSGIPKINATKTKEEEKFYDIVEKEKVIYKKYGIGLTPNYDLRR